jgi:hypothetical protein
VNELDRLVELNAAHHEIGHALAARSAGLPVNHCRLIPARDRVAATGVTDIDPPTSDMPASVWDGFAVFLFAGIAAQTRHADQVGHLDRGVARRIEQAAASDLEWWPVAARHTTLTRRRARREAERLVAARWARFEPLATRLVAKRYLPGGAL